MPDIHVYVTIFFLSEGLPRYTRVIRKYTKNKDLHVMSGDKETNSYQYQGKQGQEQSENNPVLPATLRSPR